MSDAYRTSGFTCPSCEGGVPLREFGSRLVCDECNGMLIADADFAHSIEELTKVPAAAAIADPKPTDKACPKCSAAMSSCDVTIGRLHLSGRLMRCERDGLWVSRDVMTGAYARASRTASGYSAHGGMAPGTSYNAAGSSGMSGAMASIGRAFGSGAASANLRIGQWSNDRPMVHTLFVSAHKDKTLGCPACKDTKLQFIGDRWSCTTCAGCFVEDAALAAMVQEMTNQPWDVPPMAGAGSDRQCPVCSKLMVVEVLEAVTIDRCSPHGVWFDEAELQTALHHASEPHRSGVGSWVKQLFHRHGEPQDR